MTFRTTGLLALVVYSALGQSTAVQMALSEPGSGQKEPGATAQANAAGQERITLEQALSLAERYSPQLLGAAAVTESARSGIVAARAYPNPGFTFLAGQQHARPIATPAVPGLLQHYSVTQPIETPNVRRTRIAAAEKTRDSSMWAIAAAKLDLRGQVKHAFFQVLRRKEEIEHAQENLQLVQDLRRRTQVQVKVGEAARLELTRAEAETARAQTLVKQARLEEVSALAVLRAVVSGPLSPTLEVTGELDERVGMRPLLQLREDILQQHPLILQARSEVERAEAVVENEKALRVPQPYLNAEYEEQPDLGFFRVGVTIPLPIWDKRKGQIGQAAAALNQAKTILRQRQIEISAALERAYGQYQVADEQVQSFQSGALREAQAALQAAEAAYKFGERGIIEVLDAQRVLRAVRADLLDAQYEREGALIDLEALQAVVLGRKN